MGDVLAGVSGGLAPGLGTARAPVAALLKVADDLSEGAGVDLKELAVANLPDSGLALVVNRSHLPLRGREQAVLEAVAALA